MKKFALIIIFTISLIFPKSLCAKNAYLDFTQNLDFIYCLAGLHKSMYEFETELGMQYDTPNTCIQDEAKNVASKIKGYREQMHSRISDATSALQAVAILVSLKNDISKLSNRAAEFYKMGVAQFKGKNPYALKCYVNACNQLLRLGEQMSKQVLKFELYGSLIHATWEQRIRLLYSIKGNIDLCSGIISDASYKCRLYSYNYNFSNEWRSPLSISEMGKISESVLKNW